MFSSKAFSIHFLEFLFVTRYFSILVFCNYWAPSFFLLQASFVIEVSGLVILMFKTAQSCTYSMPWLLDDCTQIGTHLALWAIASDEITNVFQWNWKIKEKSQCVLFKSVVKFVTSRNLEETTFRIWFQKSQIVPTILHLHYGERRVEMRTILSKHLQKMSMKLMELSFLTVTSAPGPFWSLTKVN